MLKSIIRFLFGDIYRRLEAVEGQPSNACLALKLGKRRKLGKKVHLGKKEIAQIKKLLQLHEFTQVQIANYFGVSARTISGINVGRSRKVVKTARYLDEATLTALRGGK